jgi:hypothetical protein
MLLDIGDTLIDVPPATDAEVADIVFQYLRALVQSMDRPTLARFARDCELRDEGVDPRILAMIEDRRAELARAAPPPGRRSSRDRADRRRPGR